MTETVKNVLIAAAATVCTVATATAIAVTLLLLKKKEEALPKNQTNRTLNSQNRNRSHNSNKKSQNLRTKEPPEINTALSEHNIDTTVSSGSQIGYLCWAHSASNLANWYNRRKSAVDGGNYRSINDWKRVLEEAKEIVYPGSQLAFNYDSRSGVKLKFSNTKDLKQLHRALVGIIGSGTSWLNELDRNKLILFMDDCLLTQMCHNIYRTFYGEERMAPLFEKLTRNSASLMAVSFQSAAGNTKNVKNQIKKYLEHHFQSTQQNLEFLPVAVNLENRHWVTVFGKQDEYFIVCDSLKDKNNGFCLMKKDDLCRQMVVSSDGTKAAEILTICASHSNPIIYNCDIGGQELNESIELPTMVNGVPLLGKVNLYKTVDDKIFVLNNNGESICQNEGEELDAFKLRLRDPGNENLYRVDRIEGVDTGKVQKDGFLKFRKNVGSRNESKLEDRYVPVYTAEVDGQKKYFLFPAFEVEEKLNKCLRDSREELITFVTSDQFTGEGYLGVSTKKDIENEISNGKLKVFNDESQPSEPPGPTDPENQVSSPPPGPANSEAK